MWAWIKERRGTISITIPYMMLAALVAVSIGLWQAKADQAEIRAQQAVIVADLAIERARSVDHDTKELAREAERACSARHQARSDLEEVIRLINTALPPRIAAQIAAQVAALKPIEC